MSSFLEKYPQNISDAAKILDKWDEKWADKIDLSILNMKTNNCILGQLFKNVTTSISGPLKYYDTGLYQLFGLDTSERDKGIYYYDNIFGRSADLEEWKEEINKRRPVLRTIKIGNQTFGMDEKTALNTIAQINKAFGYKE